MTLSDNLANIGEATLNAVFDGIIVLDQYGSVTFQNQSAKEILCQDLLGTEFFDSPSFSFFETANNQNSIGKVDFFDKLSECKSIPLKLSINGPRRNRDLPAEIFVVATEALTSNNDEKIVVLNLQNEAAERTKAVALDLDNKRLLADSAAKVEFLTNMSHEIRTPLGAILGFAELLDNEQIDLDDRSEYCEVIRRNGLVLNDLINDLLDLSKIISGKFELKPTHIGLRDTLANPLCLLQSKAWAKALQFTASYNGYLPGEVAGDNRRISQIILNIVGNAIKFTDVGSVTVLVSGKRVDNDRVKISISVSDSGCGIDLKHQKKLFTPFVQADGSLSRPEGGSGLGLSLSRKIAETMDGGVDLIRSDPNKGSIFKVSFHLKVQTPGSTVRSIDLLTRSIHKTFFDKRQLEGISILLAEDGIDNQLLFETILIKSGAQVKTVANGYLAVEALNKCKFDLIIMDLQMPVMTGYDAIIEMRKTNSSIPVLALSAHAYEIEKSKCLEAGFSDYLSKPVNSRDLCDKVASMSGKSITPHFQNSILSDPDIHQIFVEFQKKIPKKVAEIESEIKSCNFSQVRNLAHTLRGTLGGFELHDLSEMIGLVEELAIKCSDGNGNIDGITSAVDGFKSRYYGSS